MKVKIYLLINLFITISFLLSLRDHGGSNSQLLKAALWLNDY